MASAGGGEHLIDGGRAQLKEERLRPDPKHPLAFEHSYDLREKRSKALGADAPAGFPDRKKGGLHVWGLSARASPTVQGLGFLPATQKADGRLPVVASEGHEFVEESGLLSAASQKVPGPPTFHKLPYTHAGHRFPFLLGNPNFEESMTPSVTISNEASRSLDNSRKIFIMKLSEVRMKPFLLIILVFFNAYAWKTNFHGKIVTGAVLQDFVASSKIDVKINIDNVAFNAWQADVSSTYHCKEYAHRVTKYQQIFNAFGRLECRTPTPVCVCKKPGAEEGAAYYLSKAREAYIKARDAKNESDRAKCYKDAEEFLGYAIHFIQDALCPAHVFAFKEGIPDVHGDFEIWAEGQSTRWIEIMKKSQPKNIRNVIELKDTLIKMADWIATLPHRYRNPNDQIISKDSTIPGNWVRRTLNRQIAWEMRMEDLEKVVSEIGSLIKGALLYVIGR